jgi:phospholipid/cholesterol/gamma-HCH transport system substrate-binding protein
MARHNAVEVLCGAAVIAAAIGFVLFAMRHTGQRVIGGYELSANFDHVDGLTTGAEVRMAGVKIGSVEQITLNPETFQAQVVFTVAGNIKLATDSSAAVSSDGLLGGKYLALDAGGEDKILPPGGHIAITQSSMNMEALIGKYIFGGTGSAPAPHPK